MGEQQQQQSSGLCGIISAHTRCHDYSSACPRRLMNNFLALSGKMQHRCIEEFQRFAVSPVEVLCDTLSSVLLQGGWGAAWHRCCTDRRSVEFGHSGFQCPRKHLIRPEEVRVIQAFKSRRLKMKKQFSGKKKYIYIYIKNSHLLQQRRVWHLGHI